MALIFKPSSPAAAAMRAYARNLAAPLHGKKGARSRVMMGFIMRAVGDGKNVTVYVIEPGGMLGGSVGAMPLEANTYYPAYSTSAVVWQGLKGDCPPLSLLLAQGHDTGIPDNFIDHSAYALSGGARSGDPLAWTSAHNVLPAVKPKAAVMPSAILMPAVAGAVTTERIGYAADPAENRAVMVFRVSAATQYGPRSSNPDLPSFPSSYGILANPFDNDKSAESISYIELASGQLGLGNRLLGAGHMACMEWGARDGAVIYQAYTEAVPKGISENIEGNGSTGSISYSTNYPAGETITFVDTGPSYRLVGGAGKERDYSARCSRYRVIEVDGLDENGAPTKHYQATVLWSVDLDGTGAPAGLAPDTPPAMTSSDYAETALESVQTAWANLWRMQNIMLWSDYAGESGGHAESGGQIWGVGTVIARRFRPTTKRRVTYGPITITEEMAPGTTTVTQTDALMTYHDRHTVRFTIDPETGQVSYENLYQFVNCYLDRGNDCKNDTGNLTKTPGWATPLGYEHLGANQLTSYDTDVLESFEHRPLTAFSVVTTKHGVESRSSYMVCARMRELYQVLPAATLEAGRKTEPAKEGDGDPGPRYGGANGGLLLTPEGEIHVHTFPIFANPGHPPSFPYRDRKAYYTDAEMAENQKVVVFGRTGGEIVMQTGDYYPDIYPGPDILIRKEHSNADKYEYYPSNIDTGSPVCVYAPGIIAIVVIPHSQMHGPQPEWRKYPIPYTTPQPDPWPSGYSIFENPQDPYEAWGQWYRDNQAARSASTDSPPRPPLPKNQDRYLALCRIDTGALVAVSETPIYSDTGWQDSLASMAQAARTSSVHVSCVEQGAVDEDGNLTRHAVLIITHSLPPITLFSSSFRYPAAYITDDLGKTLKPLGRNNYCLPLHYIGTPLKPAKIGVTTGISAVRGKAVTPE